MPVPLRTKADILLYWWYEVQKELFLLFLIQKAEKQDEKTSLRFRQGLSSWGTHVHCSVWFCSALHETPGENLKASVDKQKACLLHALEISRGVSMHWLLIRAGEF